MFRCEVVLNWDVHKAAPHAKHHGGAGFPSPFGQGVPVKGAQHRSDAALPGVTVADKASIYALGALELVCIGFGGSQTVEAYSRIGRIRVCNIRS